MLVEVWKNGETTQHDADLIVPISSEGSIMIQLRGERRPISRIAADFEGADEIRTDVGDDYAGFGNPIVVFRMNEDTVQIRIKRGV